MKNILSILLILFVSTSYAQTSETQTSGRVTDVWETPIPDVNILVKGTNRGTQSNEDGSFSLLTFSNEILVCSAVGYGSVELTIPEDGKEINVVLSPTTTKLEGVTLKKKRRKKKKDYLVEYDDNKRLIKTSMGILDKDRSSSAIQIIDGKSLINVGTDFLTSLKNFVPGMRVVRPPSAPDVEVYLRRIAFTSIDSSVSRAGKAVFDVDGILLETAPTYLSANDIDRIAVLQRNAAISRYGQNGIGGVVIINTKAQSKIDGRGIVRRYDNSKMKDSLSNLFAENQRYIPMTPDYMDVFGVAPDELQAMGTLKRAKEYYSDDPTFFLDLAYYFRGRWKNNNFANDLLKDVSDNFADNVPVLRSLAYRYESLGKQEEALEVFLRVLQLDSISAQSYYDVSEAYMDMKSYENASKIYTRYKQLRDESKIPFEKSGADRYMTINSHNNMLQPKSSLDREAMEKEAGITIARTRIVTTWSNPNIDIGFQLINPESLSYTWNSFDKPNMSGNGEMERGYSMAQFFLEDVLKGEWQLNLRNYNAQEDKPTFLKVSVFFDFGLPTQRKVLRFFKLTPEYAGTGLFSINTKLAILGN